MWELLAAFHDVQAASHRPGWLAGVRCWRRSTSGQRPWTRRVDQGSGGHGPDGSTKACTTDRRGGKGQGLGPVPTGEGRSRPADEWAALSAGGVVAPVDGRATAVFLWEKMKRRVEYDVNRPRVS
jgi:hypothetical protein